MIFFWKNFLAQSDVPKSVVLWGDEKEVLKVLKLISLRSERSLIQFLFRFIFMILKTTSLGLTH
jgi:hypothetical protein